MNGRFVPCKLVPDYWLCLRIHAEVYRWVDERGKSISATGPIREGHKNWRSTSHLTQRELINNGSTPSAGCSRRNCWMPYREERELRQQERRKAEEAGATTLHQAVPTRATGARIWKFQAV